MMLNQQTFREIIRGRRTDAPALGLRAILKVASAPYGATVAIRNALYDRAMLSIHKADMPVISVGNLTTGGTGKTPLVIWLCLHLNQRSKVHNQKCGIAVLTRGYKANQGSNVRGQDLADEPALLSSACPGVDVVVNPDRRAGAATAIGRGADVLVLDDGFQHRRMARDLDIVTIDAADPFGCGHLLPAGLLREPVTSLGRAHAVVLTRCDQVAPAVLREIADTILAVNPGLVVAHSIHAPTTIRWSDGRTLGPEALRGRRVFAFCGIGNPEAFYTTLSGLGADLVGTQTFDDHHHLLAGQMRRILEQARTAGADWVLTTEKNWPALPRHDPDLPMAYLEVRLAFTQGQDRLIELIDRSVAGTIPTSVLNSRLDVKRDYAG